MNDRVIVVSDTGPFRYLIAIDHIDILRQMFGRVLLPQTVYQELTHLSSPDIVRDWFDDLPIWIEVVEVFLEEPTEDIGIGEQEAICLALENKADVVLMDDARARKVATQKGLQVAGTLRLLFQAAKLNLLDFHQAIEALRETNFYVSESLLSEILRRYESGE
ncbi:MAG: DUF3368 domain-containing protein [Fimbriimonadia bacterium]|nr:DUF3368 domain-containing protein [Fimbriimonadia bacterium]